MPNTTITIAAIKRSEKNQEIILIKGTDGETYSGFATTKGQPTPLSTLKVGDVIEADVITKGQYKNLGDFHVIAPNPGKGQQTAPQTPGTASKPKVVEVSGQEHGCCLNNVVLLYIAGKLENHEALVLKMWADLNRGMGTSK